MSGPYVDEEGRVDWSRVPKGPCKGRPWKELKALTLHSLLSAVDFGSIDADPRMVVAIREGLAAKDEGPKAEG